MSKKQITGIGIAVALIALYWGAQMYASNVAEGKVNEAIANAADFADIDYKKVSFNLLRRDVRISDILISPAHEKGRIRIGEIIIRDIDDRAKIPAFLSMSCNGIELNLEDLGKTARKIRELGYTEKLMVNLNINYLYDQEKKELDLKQLGLGADDAGEITISFHLSNLNFDREKIAQLLFTLPQVIFHEAKITYEDDSLSERLMKLGAKDHQTNEHDFKRSLIQKVEKEIEKEKDDFTKKSLSEIKTFLEDPKGFSISASPTKALPIIRILQVDNPKDVIKLLNVQIQS
jgi:hypothetical protein